MSKYVDFDKAERARQSFIYQLKSFELEPPELSLNQFIDLFSETQANKVLWHLLNFRSITSAESKIYGIQYCSSAIRDLEKKFKEDKSNYYVKREKVSDVDWLNKKHSFTEYVLEDL